jgi:hypothetical protein
MDGKRSDPGEQQKPAEETPASDTPISAPESYGVVDLTRLVKDDGRALIVYSRPPGR